MIELLTLSIITRQICYSIGNKINLKLAHYDFNSVIANQAHVDFIAENEDFKKSLDDWTILEACATGLADNLKKRNAKYCYRLKIPPKIHDVECSIHWTDNCSIRGLLDRNHIIWDKFGVEKIVNMFRFDILYST